MLKRTLESEDNGQGVTSNFDYVTVSWTGTGIDHQQLGRSLTTCEIRRRKSGDMIPIHPLEHSRPQ